ncbi:MAG: hypothetical protein V1922_00480 [bacterium]
MHTESKEQRSSCWVPFRESNIVSSKRVEYGQISWNPAFIPHGKNLHIDVAGTNNWLQSFAIGFPLEIKPYHPKDKNVQVSGLEVQRGGDVALTSSLFVSKVPKPALAHFVGDYETNSQTVLINFAGIADYIKTKNPQISDIQFSKIYGQLVDTALKSQARKLIMFNYVNLMAEDPHIATELISIIGSTLVSLGTEITALTSLSMAGKLNVETATAASMISAMFYILTHAVIVGGTIATEMGKTDTNEKLKKTLKRVYYEYLMKNDKDYPLKLAFPMQTNKYLSMPILSSLRKRTLVKGNDGGI